MKKFLKKANRGLLLTTLVVVILAIYIVTDYIGFNTKKETIKQTVNDYYTDMYQINTKYDGNSNTHKKDLEKIIESYWTHEKPSSDWTTTKSNMINNVNDYIESIEDGNRHSISKADFKIENMKIRKTGPGYAKVTISFSASITGSAASYVITPSTYREIDDNIYNEEIPEDEYDSFIEKYNQKTCTLSYTVENAIIELHEEDGKWKISSIDAYEYSSSVSYGNEI